MSNALWVRRRPRLKSCRARTVMSVSTVISLLASFGCSVAWLASSLGGWGEGLALTPQFHIGVFDSARSLYSHDLPYRGSIVSIDGEPPILVQRGFAAPGLYYRYLRFPSGVLWTFSISLGYPVGLFAILPGMWAIRRIARRRQLAFRTTESSAGRLS